MVSFPQVSPPKPCIYLYSHQYVLHDPPISLFSVWSPEQYLVRSTDHKAPHYLVFSIHITSLLGPNILLNTLFSDSPSLCSSPSVSDQVSHLYKRTCKIIVLYILICKFLDIKLADKRFCTEWWQAFPDFNLVLISSWIEFWFVKVVPKYWNSSTVSKDLLSFFILWLCPASDLKTRPCTWFYQHSLLDNIPTTD